MMHYVIVTTKKKLDSLRIEETEESYVEGPFCCRAFPVALPSLAETSDFYEQEKQSHAEIQMLTYMSPEYACFVCACTGAAARGGQGGQSSSP